MAHRARILVSLRCLGVFLAITGAFGCGISVEAHDVFNESGASSSASSASGAGGEGATTTAVGQGGASATTATTSGAGGASTTTTSTGSGASEDCLDGLDNDGDGAIDCADSDCQAGFVCVDDPPSGWEGYYRVYEPPYPGPALATCPDGSAPENYFTGPEGPAQCTACTCGGLQGASCGPPAISCFGSTTCAGTPTDWTPLLLSGTCQKPNVGAVVNSLSCLISGPGVLNAAGNCPASIADFPNKDAWQGQLGACAVGPVGGGCGAGAACLPRDPNDPSQSTCIRQDGSAACPAGFSEVHQAYADAIDTRGCDACSCGAPATTCGTSQYTFYDLNNCALGGNDPPVVIDPAGACTDVTPLLDSNSWSAQATLPIPQGSCAASGGAPSGGLTPTGPVVFCCQ